MTSILSFASQKKALRFLKGINYQKIYIFFKFCRQKIMHLLGNVITKNQILQTNIILMHTDIFVFFSYKIEGKQFIFFFQKK